MEVVVTTKMDGECTTMYNDYIHARSPSPMSSHPSRVRIKQLHDRIRGDIPDNWRICGENVYAQHSIPYRNLECFFFVFSIWEESTCFSWNDTKELSKLLGLHTVPELYSGTYNESSIQLLYTEDMWETCEGYVIRPKESFEYKDFSGVVSKFVRRNHVATSKHWMSEAITPNKAINDVWY